MYYLKLELKIDGGIIDNSALTIDQKKEGEENTGVTYIKYEVPNEFKEYQKIELSLKNENSIELQ